MNPIDIFSIQNNYFKLQYDEGILFDERKYEEYKKQQLGRIMHSDVSGNINLEHCDFLSDEIINRKSYRTFDQSSIPFLIFSRLLSIFKQNNKNGNISYCYASAGGLYPIDVYVYIKPDRIENFANGLYYYSPIYNSLKLINSTFEINEYAHLQGNRSIFLSSAFSIFLVYNASVSMPKYGASGYYYAIIDSGIMVQALTQTAQMLNVGLCSIGNMNFENIKESFKLNNNQVFLHAIEGGLINEHLNNDQKESHMERDMTKNQHNLQKQLVETSLRLVLLSGDWISLNLPDKIKNYFKNIEIISLGGATEASIWSIYHPIKEIESKWKSIPYGTPLANQTMYVLNYDLQPCPFGVAGELYIGGLGVASGYYKDHDRSQESFINHDLYGSIYKTGDYGIFHQEGYIEFLGRKDNQVKIQGYRIELGEIESALLRHEHVKSALVLARFEKERKHLCAYYTSEEEIDSEDLRRFLAKNIPSYMIPTYFIFVKEMPLTANGKIDRNALLDLQQLTKDKSNFKVPETNIEKRIVKICEETTKIMAIGINDNLFELGINSIDIVNFNRALNKEFECNIPIVKMFEFSKISTFAAYLSNEILESTDEDVSDNFVKEKREKVKARYSKRLNRG
jgi:SagB-type dehydrogenase family enzyme